MNFFTRLAMIQFAAISVFLPMQSYAYCAKCAAIEQKRAEENALKGPQPQSYYDQDHKDKITTVNQNNSQAQTLDQKSSALRQEYKEK